MKNPVFKHYAAYYDALYKDKNYAEEASFVRTQILKYSKQTSKLVEFGCGTGLHAMEFARLGFTIDAYDASGEMLSVAKERVETLPSRFQKKLSFHQGDIRSLKGNLQNDAVISLFHVMSYQVTDMDVVNALKSAASFLKKGGVFLFDYWHGPGVLHQPPECRVKRIQLKEWDITRVAEPAHDTLLNKVDVHYTLWLQNRKNKKIESIQEIHPMRYFFPKELDSFAENHGFKPVTHKKWLQNTLPGIESWYALAIFEKI